MAKEFRIVPSRNDLPKQEPKRVPSNIRIRPIKLPPMRKVKVGGGDG